MLPCHNITSVNIKKLSRPIDYIACEDPAVEDILKPFHTAARIIKFIILMANCDPERIVFMKHVNEIKLYSRFKCASDYR